MYLYSLLIVYKFKYTQKLQAVYTDCITLVLFHTDFVRFRKKIWKYALLHFPDNSIPTNQPAHSFSHYALVLYIRTLSGCIIYPPCTSCNFWYCQIYVIFDRPLFLPKLFLQQQASFLLEWLTWIFKTSALAMQKFDTWQCWNMGYTPSPSQADFGS